MVKAQYAILRFAKCKGPTLSRIEAHNERTKETYSSNPDIDTERSRLNFHLVKPKGKYREVSNRIIRESGCRVRKDSVTAVDVLITASPEFFNGKKPRVSCRNCRRNSGCWNWRRRSDSSRTSRRRLLTAITAQIQN